MMAMTRVRCTPRRSGTAGWDTPPIQVGTLLILLCLLDHAISGYTTVKGGTQEVGRGTLRTWGSTRKVWSGIASTPTRRETHIAITTTYPQTGRVLGEGQGTPLPPQTGTPRGGIPGERSRRRGASHCFAKRGMTGDTLLLGGLRARTRSKSPPIYPRNPSRTIITSHDTTVTPADTKRDLIKTRAGCLTKTAQVVEVERGVLVRMRGGTTMIFRGTSRRLKQNRNFSGSKAKSITPRP
mmetsp:Transcript_33506/g.64749  ORF Transcript_33506/g.64749 Transcript_33506/m.64749 type:complete len:239 (+) Transcript_33506:374-1090(+)